MLVPRESKVATRNNPRQQANFRREHALDSFMWVDYIFIRAKHAESTPRKTASEQIGLIADPRFGKGDRRLRHLSLSCLDFAPTFGSTDQTQRYRIDHSVVRN